MQVLLRIGKMLLQKDNSDRDKRNKKKKYTEKPSKRQGQYVKNRKKEDRLKKET